MDNKERITGEAAKLFMKYGIRAVTMDSIAQHLGISKRTIYEQFSDKDELLTNVVRTMGEKKKEIFNEIMLESENAIEVIFKILMVAFSHFQNTNPSYLLDLKKYHYKVYESICNKSDIRNFEMSLSILRRGMEENVFKADINIDIVNGGIHSIADSLSNTDYFPTEKFSRIEILDNLLFNFLVGIATDDGQEIIKQYRKQINNLKV